MISLAKRLRPSAMTVTTLCTVAIVVGGVGLSHVLTTYFDLAR